MFLNCSRQHYLFQVFAFVGQILRCVLVCDPHHILLDDWTRIKVCRHVVACGTYDFNTAFPCLMIRFRTDEGREERVVDVDDAAVETLYHVL